MPITLRKIDHSNWKESIALQVGRRQKSFVATNVFSLAEVSFFPTYEAMGIYHDEVMVGFLVYGRDPDDGKYWIPRMMIDKKRQHKGYGKAAMEQLIELLKEKDDCGAIYLSHEPENKYAAKLYAGLGFRDTGELNEGEIVKKLVLAPEKDVTHGKPELTTERLIVRPFLESDYHDIHEYMSLPEIYRFERGEPMTMEEARKFCEEESHGIRFWAVKLKENGKVIGNISLTADRPEIFRMWNLGYIVNPAYQGKGYAAEAARAVIRYAFEVMKVHRIVAHCSPENTPSWKVMEKCGMKKEGMSRKDFPLRNDTQGNTIWLDSLDYAILDEDFQV